MNKKKVFTLALLLVFVVSVGCTFNDVKTNNAASDNNVRKLTSKDRVKEVVRLFLRSKNNIDYRTVTGNEGIEYMTKRYKNLWLRNRSGQQIVDSAKKSKYITQYIRLEWRRIDVNEQEGTATVESDCAPKIL